MNTVSSDLSMTTKRTRLYGGEDMQPLLSPKSIALVGVSTSGTGFGASALRELVRAGIDRPLYVVHPQYASKAPPTGVRGVPSFAELPEAVDCVLVAVPAPAVYDVVRAAAERGCRAALVFSAGFGEIEGGAAAEQRLRELAASTGIRIAGPNTAGILNYRERIPLTFVPEQRMDLQGGNLSIVSQSAGLATHLGHRRNRGLGISYAIATGNSVDVTALDYVNCLLDDSATDAIMLVLEGLDNPDGLAAVGRKSCERGKPVLLLKTGRTRQGNRAAVSHTGSLAGSHEVFLSAAENAGILVYRTTEELLEVGQLFARWARKPYHRGGVAILTSMGGAGVMAADAADDHGVDLPPPSLATVQRLRRLIPSFAATGNPIDTTASPTDEVLRQCLEILAEDETFCAVVMLAASQTGPSTAQRPAAIAAAARASNTPICAVWLSSWLDAPSSEVLDDEPQLPVFRSSDRSLLAISDWIAWHERLIAERGVSDGGDMSRQPELSERQISALDDVLRHLRGEGRVHGALSESISREVIAAVGIRVPRAAVAHTVDEAVAAARVFGLPVVAKIISPDVPHKAAAGGVKIGIESEEGVVRAFLQIMANVAASCPSADLQGVLIAEMVQGGPEFMCGLVRDPIFGPVVLCGAGGAAVEELNDVGRCVGPVSAASAARALDSVRALRRLRARDPERAAMVEKQLVALMQTLGALGLRAPDIGEIDINPVVIRSSGDLVALDALVVLA
jgi:acetate---CoA ligase (ADP-forming)